MEDIIIGLDNIANSMGTGVKTIRKWIKHNAFPAIRYSDGIYRVSTTSMLQWVLEYEQKNTISHVKR